MSASIFKFPTTVRGSSLAVDVPKGAKPLGAALQDGRIFWWALVKKDAPLVSRLVTIVGTGWPLSDDFLDKYDHIDTVLDGHFVWHVFVEKEAL